jgi:hypothetical protein
LPKRGKTNLIKFFLLGPFPALNWTRCIPSVFFIDLLFTFRPVSSLSAASWPFGQLTCRVLLIIIRRHKLIGWTEWMWM